MARKKTSVYIDEDLWKKFKKYASMRGMDISGLLEEIIRNEILDDLSEALYQLAGPDDYQFDFEPVEVKGSVSELVREMRDERVDSISR